jgi:hypothetical protein
MIHMKSQHHHRRRIGSWVVAGVSVWCVWSSGFSWAETYIAGQLGYTLSQDASRVKLVDPQFASLPPGTTASNVDLRNSVMYGMKVGHYFNSTPWLGVELESFITTPHVAQQNVTLTVPGFGQAGILQPGATNRLIVVAPNLVARYRAGIVEPYVGGGPGIFLLHTERGSATTYSQSSTSVGINTQCRPACLCDRAYISVWRVEV